jgi:hypothetical protein
VRCKANPFLVSNFPLRSAETCGVPGSPNFAGIDAAGSIASGPGIAAAGNIAPANRIIASTTVHAGQLEKILRRDPQPHLL